MMVTTKKAVTFAEKDSLDKPIKQPAEERKWEDHKTANFVKGKFSEHEIQVLKDALCQYV